MIRSALLGLLLFTLFAVALEGFLRWTRLGTRVQLRSHGVYHDQFEIKWFALQDFVRENGGIDVILIGNSMVNTGIDPDILAQRYEHRTGFKVRVFNFGVEGLTVAPNAELARLLVQEYHPGTLIFVTEMRDYTAANGVRVEEQFLADEWLSAQLSGNASLRAWLKSNSFFVKYLLPYRNWNRADYLDTYLMHQYRLTSTSESGYEAEYRQSETLWVPPDPQDPDEQPLFAMFSNYSMDPGRLANLADMLSLTSTGTRVLITELPLHPNYFAYFSNPGAHAKYLGTLVPFIENHGGVFLPPLPPELIPDTFRSDYYHLNYMGAMVYSALLADQLAEICLNESAYLPDMEPEG